MGLLMMGHRKYKTHLNKNNQHENLKGVLFTTTISIWYKKYGIKTINPCKIL